MFARIATPNQASNWTHLLNQQFGQIINEVCATPSTTRNDLGAIDLFETDECFRLEADVPSLTATDVDISLDGRYLTISGEAKASEEPASEHRLIAERQPAKFRRKLRLPKAVSADDIEARVVNGVLSVIMPKTPEVTPRKIPVS